MIAGHLAGFLYCVRDILQLFAEQEAEAGAGDEERKRLGLSRGGGRGGSGGILLVDLGVLAYCSWYFSHTSWVEETCLGILKSRTLPTL